MGEDLRQKEEKRKQEHEKRKREYAEGEQLKKDGEIVRVLGQADQNLNYKVTHNGALDKEFTEWVTGEFCSKHDFFKGEGSTVPALVPHDMATWSYLMQPIPADTIVNLYNYSKKQHVIGVAHHDLAYGNVTEDFPGIQFRSQNPVGNHSRNDSGIGITPWPGQGPRGPGDEFEWNGGDGDYSVKRVGIFKGDGPQWYVIRESGPGPNKEDPGTAHGDPVGSPIDSGKLDTQSPQGGQVLYWFDTVLIENDNWRGKFFFGQVKKKWGPKHGKMHKWGRNPKIRIEPARIDYNRFYSESLAKYVEIREFETKILSSLWDPEFCKDPKDESTKALCHLFRHDQEAGYPSIPDLPIYNYLWVDEDSAALIEKKIVAETVDNTGRYWLMENISSEPKRPAIVAKNVKLKKYSGQAAFTDKEGKRLYALELVDPTSGKMEYRFNHGKARLIWLEIKRAKDHPNKISSPTLFVNGKEQSDFSKSILTRSSFEQMLDPRGFPNWYHAEWSTNLTQPEAIVTDDRQKTHGIWWDVQPCPVGENDPKTIQMFHIYHKGTGQGAESTSFHSGQVDMNRKCEFQSCEPSASKVDCQGKWEIDLDINLADVNGAPASDPSKCEVGLKMDAEEPDFDQKCSDALEGMKETDDHTVMTWKITRQACNDGAECPYPEGARKFRESEKIFLDGEEFNPNGGSGGGGGDDDETAMGLDEDGSGGGGGGGGGGVGSGDEDEKDKKDTYFEWNVSDSKFFHVRNMSMYVYLGGVFFMFMMMILLVA